MKKIVIAAAMLASGHTLAASNQSSAMPTFEQSIIATNVDYNVLDYGLYFFANNREASKWTGAANPYFDRTKPTMIYIHGWQPGATEKQKRETFDRTNAQAPFDLTNAWKSAGWNVAICYWNQFADEGEVKDAEAKVWSTQGPRNMRWRKRDGSYVNNGVTISAGTLCANQIASALSTFSGSNLRLVGHSLGSQMVINVAQQLSDKVDANQLPAAARPKRVALLDPAFLKDARSYLNNRWTGEVARGIVSYLKTKGVIFEAYRSSASTSSGVIGDTNQGLLNMVSFSEIGSNYYNIFQQGEKHEMAVWWYFWSMAYAAPSINGSTLKGPSAASTDTRIRDLMNGTQRTIQDAGRDTRTPADDTFRLANR